MEVEVIGIVTKAEFGFGGHSNAMFGLSLEFKGDKWDIRTFVPAGWNENFNPEQEYCRWTEEERTKLRVDLCKLIDRTLFEHDLLYVSQLVGRRVSCIVEDNKLKDWKIL